MGKHGTDETKYRHNPYVPATALEAIDGNDPMDINRAIKLCVTSSYIIMKYGQIAKQALLSSLVSEHLGQQYRTICHGHSCVSPFPSQRRR